MISHRLRRHARFLVAVACLSAGASLLPACAPVVDKRGYIINEKDLDRVKAGKTTKEQVKTIMGSPSTEATIDGSAWYYITSKFETYMFYQPEEVDRTVVAVYFDKSDVVQQLAYYGLKDGEIIDFQTRTTPTRGKELTVLGQLFSNLGRFNKETDSKSSRPTPGGH